MCDSVRIRCFGKCTNVRLLFAPPSRRSAPSKRKKEISRSDMKLCILCDFASTSKSRRKVRKKCKEFWGKLRKFSAGDKEFRHVPFVLCHISELVPNKQSPCAVNFPAGGITFKSQEDTETSSRGLSVEDERKQNAIKDHGDE
ncbi:Hypothetical predicted protein [Paramuricea clavata]|uniref:Uncharacterized protein n=1 Tax=Paramuricea clavata TaxID=317549 RepID=A0A7D9E048_PARCT|nr:Hypothetical predicted protein [Paramuricea clavata]